MNKAISRARFVPPIASQPGRVIRCQLHPATDQWMSGDKYGTVLSACHDRIKVKMDRSGRTLTVYKINVAEVFEVQDPS